MVATIFVALLIVAFIMFVIGVREDEEQSQGVSLILFLVLSGQALYITVPFVDSSGTDISLTYAEYGLSAFCLVFVFIDIVMLVMGFFERMRSRRGDVPYVPR